ncbi:MAG: tRNA-specific adenosine deaminase [Gammaproteobacteria bacterium]|nr:tRNA-specific adenosine deaminase [Gammaproteobacteria bacterium]
MGLTIELARTAFKRDEVPVGAVIVQRRNSEVLAAFSNQMRELHNPIAHAEILAIQKATNILSNERLVGCDMYVSLEPCPMCAHAISIARLDRLFYAAEDTKGGGVKNGPMIFKSSSCHHKPEVISGTMANESSQLLKKFFQSKR